MGNACTYNACHTTIAIVINKRHTSHRINHSITQCDTHTHTLSLSLLCPYVCICFSFSSLNNFFFSFYSMHLFSHVYTARSPISNIFSSFIRLQFQHIFSNSNPHIFCYIYEFGFNLFIYLLRCNILPFQFIALEFCWEIHNRKKGPP